MFRGRSSLGEASGDDFPQYDDHNSRQQRWGSTIDKIEVEFANSVNEDETRIVQFRRATAATTTNDYFSVFSAPGTASHFQPVPRFAGSRCSFSTRKFSEWIQLQKTIALGEISGNKRYFERSVRILNSLVLKIVNATVKAGKTELVVAVHPDLITAENIMVHDSAEEGETADFIYTDMKSVSSLDDLATKYGAMKALGIVAYELLMKGVGPPVSSFLTSALADTGSTAHLPLSVRDVGECVESGAKEMNQAERKVPRKEGGKNQGRITTAMLNSGIPYPLCRFVVDLLGGELSDGLLFRSDNSFESFSEILLDLKQMMANPDAFIHLSVKDPWRLEFGNQMHGRETEKKIIMDAASRTSGTTSNDALFEALSLLLPRNKQQIVMCHGKPGSGKSRLIMETKKDLENKGWLFLSCKFDRIVHAEPLSVMASAFEEFLEQCLGSSRQQQISANLKTLMLPDDILILTKHLPCLIKYLDDPHNPLVDIEVSKEQMHRLFHQFLAVLCATGQPIAFFADDLQWADEASIDLFVALTKASEPELSSSHRDTNTALKIMLIGSYRDNEVDCDHPLAQVLHKLKSRNSSVEVTDIAVCGFNLETLNQILSESLCLPLRRTKSLSEIVLQKTDGIAIHIIEFIGRLTMDRILCHSFVKGWEWDSEEIESSPISDSVAELFVFKLKKLPSNALRALQICSIFGSQIEPRIINFVQDFDGDHTVDITAGLKVAVELGLVEMIGTANVFKFAHDIIAEAAFDLISDEERSLLLQKLASSLIRNASASNDIDFVIFVAVDLINRMKNDAITDPEDRVLYASMNEKAGKKALAVPDFRSAAKYSESGLTFLDVCHWESHHDLTMGLHQTSVAALYSCPNGNQDLLRERINAVFRYAKSIDEEFKTRHLWISLLSTTSLDEAIKECHVLLNRLGEKIDLSDNSSSHACSELLRVKESLSEKKNQFSKLPRMDDLNKRNAMKVISSLMVFYHHQRSNRIGLVSSRMVDMTMKYGYCEESVFGVASFAVTLIRIQGDIDEGASWGRMALSLVSKFRHSVNVLLPTVYAAVYGLVLIWKEPIQATLGPLLRGCSLAFDYGNIQFAVANAELYVTLSFHCGKSIDVLLGEIELLAQKFAQHGQLLSIRRFFTPFYNILRDLKGLNEHALVPLDSFTTTDEFQDCAFGMNDYIAFETQLMIDIAHSFMLRDIKKAHSLADMFGGAIKGRQCVFNHVIIEFYASLTASQLARNTLNEDWKAKAGMVCDSMEEFCSHSKWNFENKLFLLRAECHYTEGEMSEAATSYKSAIASACNHKLVHEEAMACELAGYFFKDQNDESTSKMMFSQAHKAYMKWGAVKKAEAVLQM